LLLLVLLRRRKQQGRVGTRRRGATGLRRAATPSSLPPMNTLPLRPLLCPWYRIAHGDGQVLLEHGTDCVVLEGRAASTFLPALLPLLDGTRTRGELAEQLELTDPRPVDHALSLLADHDLLVEGPPLAADVPAPFAHAANLQASILPGVTTPATERDRLCEASIAVLGTGAVAGETARLLLASGVGELVRPDWTMREPARHDLVVAAPSRPELTRLPAWNERALTEGTEWLQVLPWDGTVAVVGPAFVPGETCCWECYRRRRRSHLEYGDELAELEGVAPRSPLPPGLVALVAGAAATLVLRRLVRDPLVAGAAAVLELGGSLRIGVHRVLRVPRCPACSETARQALPSPWA